MPVINFWIVEVVASDRSVDYLPKDSGIYVPICSTRRYRLTFGTRERERFHPNGH
ncbi:MAG: hypothetical protein CFH41_00056 [Alphaproteobacteria bacterium MarineAlpha11_Bin1]|nr:MAG: hypothetical protein CFH41_00056 [Alphaproteobacteria bacterium MarineAlpha11_Bin1]